MTIGPFSLRAVDLTSEQRRQQLAAIFARSVRRYTRLARRSETQPMEKSLESGTASLEVPGETRLSVSRQLTPTSNQRSFHGAIDIDGEVTDEQTLRRLPAGVRRRNTHQAQGLSDAADCLAAPGNGGRRFEPPGSTPRSLVRPPPRQFRCWLRSFGARNRPGETAASQSAHEGVVLSAQRTGTGTVRHTDSAHCCRMHNW